MCSVNEFYNNANRLEKDLKKKGVISDEEIKEKRALLLAAQFTTRKYVECMEEEPEAYPEILPAEIMGEDETIRDTLLDLAGYCIMTTMELDNHKNIANQRAFEEQVREQCVSGSCTQESEPAQTDTEEHAEKVILHAEENGDIEVNVPEKVAKQML